MVKALEIRLGELGADIEEQVKRALRVPHINPREHWQSMPYLKYNLSEEVACRIGDSAFSQNLYSAVNKEVLKRVFYGIVSTGPIPSEFFHTLTNWENIYFFRGRWSIRHPNLILPLPVLISEHISLGLNKLHQDHYVRKASGVYTSQPKFPESDRIREDCRRIVSV